MNNDELILARLEAMEERLAFLQAKAEEPNRLLEVLTPISTDAFRVAVEKFQVLHGRVDLDDFLELGQTAMLSVPNILWALSALEKLINLCNIMSPAITPAFQDAIMAFDKMEKNDVFKKLSAAKTAGGTIIDALSAEDIEKLGNSVAFLVKILEKVAEPKVQETITTLLEVVESINPANTKPVGIIGLATAMTDPNVKKVLGVTVEALKETGKKIQ